LSYEEKVKVDSIPWGQRYGVYESPRMFCIVAQLIIDEYLLIADNKEGCKELELRRA